MPEESPLQLSIQKDISARLMGEPDPVSKLRPIVEELLRAELKKPGASTKPVLRDVCHGAMGAMVLLNKDVRHGSVEVLKAVSVFITERSGDPMTTMSYALDGIARIAPAIDRKLVAEIGAEIESAFMGAGQMFNDIINKQKKQ
ncbi:MAG: hypothetical protein WC728_04160 [Elusimicrobiota bacterium]